MTLLMILKFILRKALIMEKVISYYISINLVFTVDLKFLINNNVRTIALDIKINNVYLTTYF